LSEEEKEYMKEAERERERERKGMAIKTQKKRGNEVKRRRG